ncbi:MAG: ABC transporter ATP-binding protein [Candidatus Methanoplasma sp.]|jgi:iron complex transport system ATP-binding protein|nr:ABC transporter ATP-binding protein [Candidatus Methanoplasma sp.]
MFFNVSGMEFSYRSDPTLKDITFDVGKGEVLTLLGPNGVGKTTLLKCLNRVLEPSAGSVLIEETDVHAIDRKEAAKVLGYVPQRSDISKMTVFDAVLLGRRPYIDWDATERDLKITSRILKLIGLEEMSLRYIDEISGGEYQLVQIARALAQQPKVLLMDEPTSNLDISNQHAIMDLIRKVVKRNDMTAIMTLHDLNLAVRYSDKFVMMHEGSIHAAGDHGIITPENIRSVYHIDAYVETIKGIPIVIPK